MTPGGDIEPETDRALDEFLDAASEEAESDGFTRPPFGAVLERARVLDPELRPPSPELAREPGPAHDGASMTAELRPFVEAARAEAEHDVRVQEGEPRSGLPRRSGVTRWVAVTGVLAAAAALVLLFGLLEARNALRAEATREDSQAIDQFRPDRPVHEAETGGEELPGPVSRAPKPRPRPRPTATAEVIPEEPVPLEQLEPSEVLPEEAAPLEPSVETPAPAESSAATRRERKQRTLQRLDDQASERLAAGDRAGAEKAYRALVRRGGRSGLAELAYGDLFTLAHARGDRSEQRRLWREYLGKFPRGRFADDANAGLCRQGSGAAEIACWERYLDEFPTGAYHRQAERALENP